MRTYEELKAELEINRNDLDDVAAKQAQLYAEVAEGYAIAADKRDSTKHVVDVMFARKSNEFRAAEKLSDQKTKDLVEADHEYNEAYALYLNKKKEATMWAGLMNAFDERHTMIKGLQFSVNREYGMFMSDHDATQKIAAERRKSYE